MSDPMISWTLLLLLILVIILLFLLPWCQCDIFYLFIYLLFLFLCNYSKLKRDSGPQFESSITDTDRLLLQKDEEVSNCDTLLSHAFTNWEVWQNYYKWFKAFFPLALIGGHNSFCTWPHHVPAKIICKGRCSYTNIDFHKSELEFMGIWIRSCAPRSGAHEGSMTLRLSSNLKLWHTTKCIHLKNVTTCFFLLHAWFVFFFFTKYYDLGPVGAVPRACWWKGYYRTNKLKMTTSNVIYNTVTKNSMTVAQLIALLSILLYSCLNNITLSMHKEVHTLH